MHDMLCPFHFIINKYTNTVAHIISYLLMAQHLAPSHPLPKLLIGLSIKVAVILEGCLLCPGVQSWEVISRYNGKYRHDVSNVW